MGALRPNLREFCNTTRRREFIEQGRAEATPKDRVIGWMPISQVPPEMYEEGRFIQSQRAELGGDYLSLD